MASLKDMASSLQRSIEIDLASFLDDYGAALKQNKSMAVLRFHKRELEILWEKIVRKYDSLIESPLLDDPVEATKIDIKDVQRRFKDGRKCYSVAIISMEESIDALGSIMKRGPSGSSTAVPTESSFNVPPCDIQNFTGDYACWASFRDMFTAVYGKNSRLSGVEKLFYLKQKTEGEAREIVDNAPLTNEGFSVAWECLSEQYENKRMQVNAQIKILLSLPPSDTQSGTSVRRLQRTINGCISHLKSLSIDTTHWDPILIYLCSSKLPTDILQKFEETLSDPSALPEWIEMDNFLTNTYKGLESVADIKSFDISAFPLTEIKHNQGCKGKMFHMNVVEPEKKENRSRNVRGPKQSLPSTQAEGKRTPNAPICKYCESDHVIKDCPKFEMLGVTERIEFVKRSGCCYNCLAISHTLKECRSPFVCRYCGRRHHTMLHKPYSASNTILANDDVQPSTSSANLQPSTSNANASQTFSTLTQSCCPLDDRKKLLGTAVLKVDFRGSLYPARALIDPASDFSFISDALRRKLQLPTVPIIAEISGLNEVVSARSTKLCEVILRSNTQDRFDLKIQAIVVKTLSRTLPTHSINPPKIKELDNIELADPYFFYSRPIDFIIGSDFYPQILRSGVKRNVLQSLVAQDTEFGWILTGPIDERQITRNMVSHFTSVNLDKTIQQFWEVEEVPKKPLKSKEDEICEKMYARSTLRLPSGRYQVNLPFRSPETILGSSRHIAMAQFLRNEKNLMRNPVLKEEYDSVLKEYISLGHMTHVSYYPNNLPNTQYYLPHHAVVRPERTSTKVRVVFNASSKSSNGSSLNDALYTGPTLQKDLVVLIMQWRFFKIVFSADIQKMYRQISLNPKHTPYQRILYRENINEPIRDYELNTVTFGVSSAPYLAIRSLLQLAYEVKQTHPLAANILQNFMYVDDVLAGSHTISDAKRCQGELISALETAGFPLRKWIANVPELLTGIPQENLLSVDLLTLPEVSATKTLGIRWNAKSDKFFFNVPLVQHKANYTKRVVLSEIARLFDPAGWLAPIIVTAKIIMQQIWQDDIDWDENLSPHTLQSWQSFVRNLVTINNIEIPRWICYTPKVKLEFHGFCDSSERAYAAAIYTRVVPAEGPISVNLLIAKTRVAPLKVISLPKLELCGATLLAELAHNLLSQLKLPTHSVYYWTDSSIVLAWLRKPPTSWNTFVANRVNKIADAVGVQCWGHVASQDNPADVATRGCDPEVLRSHPLWWNGPTWLQCAQSAWPQPQTFSTQLEAKPIRVFMNIVETDTDILSRFSTLSRALRVLSYVFRFYHHTSHSHKDRIRHSGSDLCADEIKFVKERITRVTQMRYFEDDYIRLSRQEQLNHSSPLLPLSPFIDTKGIMRANGRLVNSHQLTYDESHPILLPYNACLSRLLIQHIHRITLHGGNQTMLRVLRSTYWIPKAKNLIRTIIHKCIPCVRYKGRQANQLMAALPAERSGFSRPFTNTGIDFAGPVEIKSYSGRCCKITKGYICVFVCFSTKAIHLEPSSDLSTQAFMAAFARFFSRRGCPSAIYSDNGTNFVGASGMVKKERQDFFKQIRGSVTSAYSFQEIVWHFIPPGAPHMGGLWEAGVKSFKAHMKKITLTFKYTFEELATLLARIESCLNSRPLSPSSEDPEDLNPLTPGHFLIGTPLLTPAEPDFSGGNLNLVNRWQRLKIQHQIFCRRWKEEYLKELHKRYKWNNPQRCVQEGDLVVIRQDNVPPNEWSLGRVIKVYPGSDHRTRVVDLRTSTGIITRPIVKVVVLPIN